MPLPDVLEWKVDNHTVTFMLDQAEVKMFLANCPVVIDGPCRFGPDGECIVRYYIQLYGIDLNVGSVIIDQEFVPIAWSYHGERNRLDEGQIWIIPVDDSSFGSWLASFATEVE